MDENLCYLSINAKREMHVEDTLVTLGRVCHVIDADHYILRPYQKGNEGTCGVRANVPEFEQYVRERTTDWVLHDDDSIETKEKYWVAFLEQHGPLEQPPQPFVVPEHVQQLKTRPPLDESRKEAGLDVPPGQAITIVEDVQGRITAASKEPHNAFGDDTTTRRLPGSITDYVSVQVLADVIGLRSFLSTHDIEVVQPDRDGFLLVSHETWRDFRGTWDDECD
jgi:hypothetical protein